MQQTTKDVFEAIKSIYSLSTDLVEQEALYLDNPLKTARGFTSRIVKGDMVRIAPHMDDRPILWNCNDTHGPTHVILSCWGTIYSGDLQVICEEIGTDNTITIKL